MARGAAIRRVDLRVADQAVRHLGEVRVSDFLAFLNASMARSARVLGIEVTPEVTGRGEVILFINRVGDDLRHVSKLQMLPMAEAGERGRFRLTDHYALRVATDARGSDRQKVIFYLGAGGDGRMAVRALGDQLEVEFVREVSSAALHNENRA